MAAVSIDVSTSTLPNRTTLVDEADYERFVAGRKPFAVRVGRNPKTEYVCISIDGKNYRLHRLLLGITDRWTIVDHINGNGLDNRRENLRICTQAENLHNRGKNRDNTSGFKGVSWRSDKQRWEANIDVGGKKIRLGRFKSKEDAAAAYAEAAKKYHGAFARSE